MDDDASQAERQELVTRAQALGIERPDLLSVAELGAAITQRSAPIEHDEPRSWLGVARDLLASVIEQGLHLPDAAALLRAVPVRNKRRAPQPVATVTLAEIYAAQGHADRARAVLAQLLAREPSHAAARRLLDRLDQAAPGAAPDAAAPPVAKVAAPPVVEATAAPATRETEVAAGRVHAGEVAGGEPPPVAAIATRGPRFELCAERRGGAVIARWRAEGADAPLVLRMVTFEPTWDGARRRHEDWAIATATGERELQVASRRAELLVALGTLAHEFRALAVARIAT